MEFPRIDDRRAGLPARYAVTVGSGSLVHYDLDRGVAKEHRFGSDENPRAPGEAVFVPAGSGRDELASWYIAYVYDPVRNGSDLIIIDASTSKANPLRASSFRGGCRTASTATG